MTAEPRVVVLALGSNLGDRLASLQAGLDSLCREALGGNGPGGNGPGGNGPGGEWPSGDGPGGDGPGGGGPGADGPGADGEGADGMGGGGLGGGGLRCTAVSGVYETAPVGGPPQSDYLNAVVLAESALPCFEILRRCQAAEAAQHRVRLERWGPRTLDVDVIDCGGARSDDPALTLPHPRAHERAFVLAPWLEVAPDAVLPGRGAVADLLAALGTSGVRRLPGAGLSVSLDRTGRR